MKNELQEIFEALPIVVFRWKNEPDWPVDFVSNNVEDLLGFTHDEVMSDSFSYSTIIHPEDLVRTANEVMFYSESGAIDFTHEPYRLITKTGKIIWVRDKTHIHRDANGKILYYNGFIDDITKQYQTALSLISSQRNYKKMFEMSPVGKVVVNRKGNIISSNKAFQLMTGYDEEELMSMTIKDVTYHEDLETTRETVRQIFEDRTEIRNHLKRYVTKDNRIIWGNLSVTLFEDAENGQILAMGVIEDITYKKQFEDKLKRTNRNLEIISKINLTLLFAETDKELFFSVCELLVNIAGYPMVWISEILNLNENQVSIKYKTVYSHDVLPVDLHLKEQVVNCNECHICKAIISRELMYQDSSTSCLNCQLRQYRSPQFKMMISIPIFTKSNINYSLNLYTQSSGKLDSNEELMLLDITNYIAYGIDALFDNMQKKKLQEIINNERNELQTTINNIAEGIINTSSNGLISLANKKAWEILDIDDPRSINSSIYNAFEVFDNQNDKRGFNPIDFILYENEKNGKGKLTINTKKNNRKVIAYTINEIMDLGQNFVGVVFVFTEITDEIKYEAQRALSQKMEAIGQLASGIAHEINTPLQYVGDNTYFLKDAFEAFQTFFEFINNDIMNSEIMIECKDKITEQIQESDLEYLLEEIPSALQGSLSGIEKVSNIVKAMKNFAHSSGKTKAPENINKGIEVTAIISRNEWKYSAELITDLAPDLPMVNCLLDEINQVILNMVVNSAHAIQEKFGLNSSEKGEIKISTSYDEENVIIKISDNGNGIDKNKIDRIFDPFFTTKEVGRGTGQGLSISHDIIVNKHNGRIFVDSVQKVGTTFTILIPIKQS